MKTSNRRRSRLRSSQYASERWMPSPMIILLAVGVVCGIFLGLRSRLSGSTDSLQEHYLLLVSDLYAQGAPLTSVHDRLVSVGYANPAAGVLAVADQLASSHDTVKQQEADQLRQFSDALAVGDQRGNVATVSTVQPATSTVIPTSPTTAPLALLTATPAATDTPAPAETPTPQVVVPPVPADNSSAGNPAPAPTPVRAIAPVSTAGTKKGTVQSADHQPVIVRSQPNTKSAAVAVAPNGATVYVKAIVKGEAVLPGGTNWFQVIYNGHEGYIYGTLVKVGG